MLEIETLINIRIATAGLVVAEVPSFERSRIHQVGNLSAFSDGIRVLRTILYERFIAPRREQHFPGPAPLDTHERHAEPSPTDIVGQSWAGSDCSSIGLNEAGPGSTVRLVVLANFGRELMDIWINFIRRQPHWPFARSRFLIDLGVWRQV